jgi:hypothetical protein
MAARKTFVNLRYLYGIPGMAKPVSVRVQICGEDLRVIRFGKVKATIPLAAIDQVCGFWGHSMFLLSSGKCEKVKSHKISEIAGAVF